MPLSHGYATTMRRAQGATLDMVALLFDKVLLDRGFLGHSYILVRAQAEHMFHDAAVAVDKTPVLVQVAPCPACCTTAAVQTSAALSCRQSVLTDGIVSGAVRTLPTLFLFQVTIAAIKVKRPSACSSTSSRRLCRLLQASFHSVHKVSLGHGFVLHHSTGHDVRDMTRVEGVRAAQKVEGRAESTLLLAEPSVE
eukprot:6163299-Amphidinium_carterae.1